jgi:phospholipid-transporting ATPase
MRDIPEDEYKKWAVVHSRAAATINGRQDALDKAAEIIERDLFLLGATAIEDKLQDGVPETIYTLQQAGIKVWVLTGDRQETAINIGLSCRLISESMSLVSRPIQERSCRPVPGTNTDFSTCRSSSTKTLLSIPRTS